MKTCFNRLRLCFPLFRTALLGGSLLQFGLAGAPAGLNMEMNVIRYHESGFYFYPSLNTNNTPPNLAFGDYYIASSGFPNSGSFASYRFDTNGFNQIGGLSYGYGDFAAMLLQLTNGTWSISATNVASTNVYHFSVTTDIDSNSLPLVSIDYPPNGGINIPAQPTFIWQGPTNYGGLVVYEFNDGANLPLTSTNWSSPRVLYQGLNDFTVHYDSNSPTAVVASVPQDDAANPISGWVSTTHFQDYLSTTFSVGLADVSGTSHTLVAHYAWDGTNTDGTPAGLDTSGHGYTMDFSGGYGAQGGENSIADAAAGLLALQFHNGDGSSAGYAGWNNTPPEVLSALAGSFSVSCWIKTAQSAAWDSAPAYYGAGIVSADNGGLANDVLPMALTGGKIGFNTGGPTEDVTLNSVAAVNDGNYHHIVVTRNQGTGQKIIYIDGVLDSFGSGVTGVLGDPQKLTIGALGNAWNSDPNDGSYYNGFNGEVDDLQIYSGVLSAGEVAILHGNPGVTVPNGSALIGGHSIVARYDFEDTTSPGIDTSGLGNDANCGGGDGNTNFPDTFSPDAAVGSFSRNFLGHTFVCFTPPATSFDHLTNALSGSFTITAWIKTTQSLNTDGAAADSGAILLFAENQYTNSTVPLALTGSKVAIGVNDHNGNNTTLHSQTSVNDGQYHQIAVTRNQPNGLLKVYVDGTLDATATGPTDLLCIPSIIALGGYFNGYDGLLDDVQIYAGVCTDVQIATLYAHPGSTIPDEAGYSPYGPVVHYDFNENTALAADVSGNHKDMVQAGNFGGSGPGISLDAAAGVGSVSFDGSSYLTAPADLLATLAGDFTVSLWLKTSQSFGNQGDLAWAGAGVIAADSPNSGAKDLIPVALTGGQVAFNVGDGISDDTLNSSATVNDDAWHHVVVTRSLATGNRQIFIDGALDSSKGGTTMVLNTPVLLTIGAKSDASNPDPASPDVNGSNGYEGLVDDIQIYNRVLSSGEVAYLHSHPGVEIAGSEFDAALNTSGLSWITGGATNWFVETTNTYDGVSAAQSGPIEDGQTNWIQTTLPSDGVLSFYWQISSEQYWDFLTFYVNGVAQDAISGEVAWTQKTYLVHAGDVIRWEYTKDANCCFAGMDAGFLDQVSYTPSSSLNFNAALGTTNWNWTVSGDAPWFTEGTNTHDGFFAAQSGPVTNGQSSTLQTTITGPGTLSFWTTTIGIYDGFYLAFGVDGQGQSLYSGYNGYWELDASVTIPPGQHTVAWTAYGGDSPADMAFLDQVSLSPDYSPLISSGPVDGNVPGAGYNFTVPVKLGSNAVLVVQLTGNPAPTIRWYHNGNLVTNATGATLVITNTQFSDTGYYQLSASNYLGTATSSYVYLKVYQDTDLQPLSLSVPPVVSSGSLVPIVWTVTNTGPAAVSNYYDALVFSAPVITPDFSVGSLWSVYETQPVLPGSVYSVTNTTHRFANIPAGNYTLVLNVDANNDIIETNENNNSFTNIPITVINPDLQPGNLQVSPITNLGISVFQFTYTITNNGPGILDGAQFYDELFISTNATLDNSAIGIRQINQSPSLGAGQYFTSTNTATMPLLPSGDYYLIVHVDHYGFGNVGYISEVSETNNYAAQRVHLLEPDLVPTNIIAPAMVSSREPLSIGWNIQNQGDGLATNLAYYSLEWSDGLYLSTNQQVNAAAIQLGNTFGYNFTGYSYYYGSYFTWNTPLAPGQVMTNVQSVIIPNVAAGDYYLVLSVDAGNTIREINETNNVFARPITLGTLDLMPTAFSAPPTANARSTIPVTWAVTNQGTGTVYPQWVDRVFISTNAVLDRTATLLGEFVQTNAVAGGAVYAVSNTITLNGVGAGNYYLLLSADAGTNVMEVNHSNNIVVSPLLINSPDLVAAALTVAPVVSSQQPLSPVYSVSNAGPVTAYAGWSDRLWLSPDGNLGTNNLLIGELVPGLDLAVDDSYSRLVNTTVPAVPAGDYLVLLQANANSFFAENNSQNNLLAKPVHINNPDLVVTNFAAPTTIVLTQYSQSFEADWTVLNQGAGNAYVSWGDYLYLSRTNVLDGSAVNIGGVGQNPVLGSGQSYLAFLAAHLPDGLQGNYNLILSANDYRSIYESSYTNNLVVHPVNLVVPPVPVLSVVSVDSPADAWSGQQIYATWTLTNAGTAAVSGSFYDVVYLCSSAGGASPQIYGAFQFTGQIQPGQAIVRQQKISLPINLQGTFWVALQTDYNRNIFEFTYRTNDFLVASHPLVVHLTPTPNLAIASMVVPTNMFSGGEGTVAWVVTNSGAGPTSAPYWDDAVYLCDNTNFYTASYRLLLAAPNNVAYLNPGESYASSAHVSLPRGITGTFYFILWADAGNNVFEGTNENDNASTSPPVFVAPSPIPDLQVTTVQPPHDAFSGQSVSVTYAVTNFGLGQTQPSEVQWRDRVYISTNGTLDSTATYLGDIVHNGGLIPAAGYRASSTLTLPVGISGDWYFIVTADIFNQVYEAAFEDNNDRTAAYATHIALTPPPDLVATITQAPTNALSGHALAVTYTVFNNGTTTTPNSGWNDHLYFWTNAVFDGARAYYQTTFQHYGALAPGAGYTNTISVVLPASLTGTNYLFVQNDAYKAVFELNKTNNLAVATNPVVIQFVPSDLAVTSLTAPVSCNAGAGILVNWAVTNRGPGDTAVATWSDRLILSQNILPGAPSDVLLVQQQHFGLLGTNGAYAVSNLLVQVPSSVSAGSYQLFLVADIGNNVPVETNWANNVYGPVPISITAHSPDLRVVVATGPTNAVSGATVTVNWTVTNAGDLPVNSTYWYDAIYLSRDGLLGPDAVLLGYRQKVGSLPSGGTYTNNLAMALPVNVQSNYFFVVVADAFNYIPEAGAENNNSYVIAPPIFITLAAVPDLAVTAVLTPTNAYEGQNFHLSWVVKNIGSTNANSSWYDVAYLSADQILDPSLDTYLGYSYQTHALAPGESYTNAANFPIPQGLAGPFYVFVTTDPGHAVDERGQWTNNTAYNPQAMLVQLLPPVDLVAGRVTIPVNAVPGQNMTVSYTVQNQGSNSAVGSWVDSLFISADTNWDVGDKLFGSVTHNGDVPPGGSYTNVLTAPLPGVLPGDYHLIVRSDILNHLTEADKSNNVAASLNSAAIDVERLTFGTPVNGTIGTGQFAFYKLDATNGQTIRLQFSSIASLSANELFLKFGAMPDSGTFDAAANAPFVANPQIYFTATNTGTHYLLVKCNFAAPPAAYTLQAVVLPFTVTESQPAFAGNGGATTFLVRGALFDDATQFQLSNVGTNATGGTNLITARSVMLQDSSTAFVTFDLAGAQTAFWDMHAINSQPSLTSVTLSNAVLVVAGAGAELDVSIDGPLAVNEPSQGYAIHSCLVDYGNSGYSDAPPPLILVDGVETTVGTTLANLGTKTIQLLGRSLVGPANILRPQTYATKVFYFRGGGTELVARAITVDSTVPMTDSDWTNIETSVRPAGIADADWLTFWSNIRPRIGQTWGDYVQFLNRVAEKLPAEQREVSALIGGIYTNQPGYHASSVVTGAVLGSTNGLPQVGVQVGLISLDTNAASPFGGSAVTDQNGQFVFPNVAPGQYSCSVANTPFGQFDMNRDGQADLSPPTFTVSSTGNLTNQAVYLFQPPPVVFPTNDADATLTLDSQGVLHAFWYHQDHLWHTWNHQGNWVDAAPITTNYINGFSAAANARLVDGSAPGLIVVWSQAGSNSIDLFYSVGKNQPGGGYSWSQPVQLTQDAVQNYAPAVVVGDDGLALITYLKRGIGFHDDSDVYYSAVNVASGTLLWNSLVGQVSTPNLLNGNVTVTTTTKITIGYGFSKAFSAFGNTFQLAAALDGEAEANGCTGTGTVKATGGLNFNTENWAGGIFAAGDLSMQWYADPELCAWVYNGKASVGNLHFGGTIEAKNAVFTALKAWPPTFSFAAATEDFMNDFARWAHVRLQNSIGFGLQVNMNDCHWTAPPLDSFGIPTVGSSDCEIKGFVKFGVTADAGRSDMNIDLNAQPQTFTAAAGGNGLSSSLELVLKFGLKPEFKPLSLTASGTVTFELWGFHPTLPAPSLVFTFDGQAMPARAAVQPRSGSTTLPGWNFVYDPAASVGTPNVYGLNSVLSTVATDTANDGAPALAKDTNGVPYQVWYKDGDPFAANMGSQVYVADYIGTHWTAPVVIPNTRGFNSFVTAATDRLGQRLAVWVHADASSITPASTADGFFAARNASDVYFSTFNGTVWSQPQTVAATAGPDGELQLSRQTNGDVLAVWTATDTDNVMHLMASAWNGTTWTAPEEISSGQINSPTAQQVGGTTYVLWTQTDETNYDRTILQSESVDGFWSKPMAFAPAGVPEASSLAAPTPAVTVRPHSVFDFAIDDSCCKCKGKLTPADPTGVNVHCGVAQNGFDYVHCKRLFVYKACQVRPSDPNNIVGPEGYGPERWVPAATPLNYLIQFENDPVLASAPAKRVSITLPLDGHFDPRTFRLGDFGFGGLIFNIPAGSAFYQTRLDLSATKGYYVDLIAGVDVQNQQAFWTLTTIDPATGDVPQNALIGFLPPNNTPPEGDGFVSCAVTPLAGVTNGSPVAAKATIIFDNQPPMDTPYALNTLQTGQPVSGVLPLPAVSMNPTFDVAWRGVATANGSGVASFDIYTSANGGGYTPWLQGTTLDHAPYVGQPGATYAFYSIAHDNVGNVQPTPTNADAVTFVSSNLPPVLDPITNLVVKPDSKVVIRLHASDANGDALTYSLISAPASATLDATNGTFTWHAGRADAETTNLITVAVTDNGIPPLGTNQSFAILVGDYLELTLGETNLQGGQTASLPVSLSSSAGATNLVFAVQVPEDLLTNWTVAGTGPKVGATSLQDNVTNILISLSAAAGQTLSGTQQVSTLTFRAVTNQVSGFITLPITRLNAVRPEGTAYGNYFVSPGTVIVVQNEPLLRATLGTNQSRSLQLYGKLAATYQLVFSTNLTQSAGWQPLLSYTQTNGVITLPLDSSNPVIFYQLRQP